MNPPISPPCGTDGPPAIPVQKVISHGPSLELDGLRGVVERDGVVLRAVPPLEECHSREGLEERLRKPSERCGIIYLGARREQFRESEARPGELDQHIRELTASDAA